MKPARTVKTAGLLALVVFLSFPNLQANTDPFHIPDAIAPNVAFWTKVYATYPTGKGIVHDNLDLNIIYEVIDLLPYDAPGASKINSQRMKRANQKYEQILRRLAIDPSCSDSECQRVAVLFPEPRSALQYRQAADRVRCQIGQMDRFREGLVRSGAYIDQIRAIFKSYNLPEDLAYLPHVESSFNPNAYSKAGAAGMWQFTHSTGKRFMQVGYTVDERRDPITATHAAAQLLRENYAQLGDWALAVTAYNHGTSGMKRAKEQHGEYARIFQSYQSRSFKFASRNFYSEFLAAREVASNYKAYFGEMALTAPVPYRMHVLDGYASFAKLSKHFGVTPQVLKSLNPALRQPVLAGQKHVPKGYALRLPATSEAAETLMAAAIPETLYQKDQKPSLFYTVKRGDTVGKIARSHGVEIEELVMANNLDKRATILPRQTLRIPSRGEKTGQTELPLLASNAPNPIISPKEEAVASAKAISTPAVENQKPAPEVKAQAAGNKRADVKKDNKPADEVKTPVTVEAAGPVTAAKAPEELNVPKPAPAAPVVVAAAETVNVAQPPLKLEQESKSAVGAPEVQASESEASKAEPDESTPAAAAFETAVPTAPVKKEEPPVPAPALTEPPLTEYPKPTLASIIPTAQAAPEKEGLTLEALRQQVSNDQIVVADVGFESIIKVNGRPVGVIRVEIEETLGHFADWADVRTQQIRDLNGLSFNGVIHLHQKIKIPLHRVTAETFEQNRYEFHKRLQEDFFAVYRIGELQDYYVQYGDNYWTLSQSKFEIPMWLLKHCNPETDLADLQINQKLIIPVVEKASADDASPADEQGTQEEMERQGETPNQSLGEV